MFEDIRPYNDSEINAAMQRIADNELFPLLATYVFPDREVDEVRNEVRSLNTIYGFQRNIMYYVNCSIIANTISQLTSGGFEHLTKDGAYLFVSNHRDIMLDASLLQNILVDHGHDTSEITFGANLMQGELVIDIGKSNKMFRVERPTKNIREFYLASKHLSDYIRSRVCELGRSVWIAQRNGRTKDGVDRTDAGIINMFRMSSTAKNIASIAELNIVPMAISYEWEPCDVLKALELYAKEQGPYVKREGEDLNSILTGIRAWKGDVHIELCKPITADDLRGCDDMLSNEFNKRVAALIDERICSSYRLMSNNYIAHDIRSGSTTYASHYTEEQLNKFVAHLAKCDTMPHGEAIRERLLAIYANPVDSKNVYM